LAAAAALVLAACGGGDGAAPTGPTAAPTTTAPTTTAPATTAPMAGPVDYGRPGVPRRIGTGLVAAASPDGTALVVAEEDPAFPEPGCEGQPEPVLSLLPLDGGSRRLLTRPGGGPVRGRVLPGPGDAVALVDECEGFLQELQVGTLRPGGELAGLAVVPAGRGDEEAPVPRVTGWAVDGQGLLGGAVGPVSGDGLLAEVAVGSGAVEVVLGFPGSSVGPAQVGQLADGRYVAAFDGRVAIRSETGELVSAAVPGTGFVILPDGATVVAYGDAVTLLAAGRPPVELVPPARGRQVVAADVSPDGRAVAYATEAGPATEVAVVLVADRRVVPVRARPGRLGRPRFTLDGRALAYNRFGGPPGFVNEVELVRFGG